MTELTRSLCAWGSDEFNTILKKEIEALDPDQLPLQEGLSRSSYATGENIQVMILSCSELPDALKIKAGIFYSGIIAGCSCADDPTPINEENEYCEVELTIDKSSASTEINLISG